MFTLRKNKKNFFDKKKMNLFWKKLNLVFYVLKEVSLLHKSVIKIFI